jgi:hypothetical protein
MIRNIGICLTLATLLGIGVGVARALPAAEPTLGLHCTTWCSGNICNTNCY